MKRALTIVLLVLASLVVVPAGAAGADPLSWKLTPTGTDAQLRGLSVVSRHVAWASGARGTVLRTVDGGRSWQRVSPPDTATLDFRDIEAFDARTAVALSIGNGEDSRIYRTGDGGRTWTESFRNTEQAAFYNCVAFFDRLGGLAVGDPVEGEFRVLSTSDGGRSWQRVPGEGIPPALEGEFQFSASGQCLTVAGKRDAWIATGGSAVARVLHSADRGRTWTASETPLLSNPSAGVFAVAFRTPRHGVAIGGDFLNPAGGEDNLALTHDGGRTWREPVNSPAGYRSAVTYHPFLGSVLLAVGPTGSDISLDGGRRWHQFDDGTFDTVECGRDGACWASGAQCGPVTTARRLLADIDGLPYGARQRHLATTARTLPAPKLARLLDELHAGDGFARRIGLQVAYVAGDRGYVERCLSARDTGVVARALGAAVRLGLPPAVLVERLAELPTALRGTLYQDVRRRRATEFAEALLPAARARFGDVEAAVLLPACTPGTVAALLPELGYAVTGWRMIGHRHSAVLLDHVDAELAGTPKSGWARLLDAVGSGLASAVLNEPGRVLEVLSRTAPHAPVPAALARTIGLLARHDPARLLRVLLDPRRPGGVPGGRALWRALLGATDDELIAFGRAVGSHRLVRFLRVVPPSRRAAVYAGVVGPRDLTLSHLPVAVLDELPAAARAAEAERLLGLHRIADDPSSRLAVTARLPWDRASGPLREATRRSTADERAEGYDCLIRAAAVSRDPDVLAEMLGSLGRLRNEQDPVRQVAFRALAAVPPWLFRPAGTPELLTLMTDAVQARDCSWLTQSSVRALISRLIRHGALTRQAELVETGLEALTRLGDKRPALDLYGLDRELPRGGEHQVFEALRSRLEADARLGRFEVVLALAHGLRRRAWDMPDLQALLDRARHAADDHIVRWAIELWLAPRATRDERVGQVFAADRSTITFPLVHNGIGSRRTDLLDDVFTKSLYGRFLKRGVRYVPRFHGCFGRWLPRQCAAYAALLAKSAAPRRSRTTWDRVVAVRQMAGVPGTVELLRGYLDDVELAVSEAALATLAWTDEPADVLDDLLAHVDDDKARVAVYAVTRCARFVPPARLGEALRAALNSRKVTSRKEAVRLLAAHHAPGAAETLASVWHEPGQHRDVRRAVVSAARWCLPDAWPLLAAAAADEHAVATAVLDLDPYTLAPQYRARYASLIHTVADDADPDTARLGLATLARWARWDQAGTDALVGRVADLADTASWRQALAALVAGCTATEDPAPLVAVVTRLLSTPDPVATADRDLPARQRIQAVAELVQRDAHEAPTLRTAAAALSDALGADPTQRTTTIYLAAAAVAFEPDGDGATALGRVAALADEPRWAYHAHRAVQWRLGGRVAKLPQAHLYELATAAAPLLGLAIASQAGPEAGWPDHWRTFVTGLRDHADPDVRLTALDTFTTRE